MCRLGLVGEKALAGTLPHLNPLRLLGWPGAFRTLAASCTRPPRWLLAGGRFENIIARGGLCCTRRSPHIKGDFFPCPPACLRVLSARLRCIPSPREAFPHRGLHSSGPPVSRGIQPLGSSRRSGHPRWGYPCGWCLHDGVIPPRGASTFVGVPGCLGLRSKQATTPKEHISLNKKNS